MGTISPQQTKSLTEALQAARAQRQQSEVENFVRNGNFYDSPADRNREMLSNLILNRDVFSQSLGNSLVRTRSELGIAPDFGQSKYDKYAQVLSDMQNPTDLRAYYQPTALKVTNGVLGAITTTATTFLQPFADIASLVYVFNPGLNDPNTDWTGTSRLNSFLNNPIQQSLRNVEKVFADIAPIYRYEAERDPNLNLFQRMSYGGWWAEDFIKNIGFTVGAALGGKAMGSGLDWVFNRINTKVLKTVNPTARELFKNTARALGKAGVEGDNIDNLVKVLRASDLPTKQKLIDQLLNSRKVANASTTVIGMVTGAGTEAHIEALQARENFVDENKANIDRFYSVGSFGAKLEYENAIANHRIDPNTTFEQYCNMQKSKAYELIEKNGNNVMRSVYFLESALLFATNMIAWRDFYDTSFHVQRNQLREHGMFLKGYSGKHRGNLRDVTERKNRLGAASRYLRGIVTEGGEEMAQSGIVEGTTQYVGSLTNNQLYRDNINATNPAYAQRTIGILNATWKGLQHMLGTHDSWTEGFVGGIMGAIGLPGRTMTRAQRKAEGISLFNRKAWEMKGGLFEAYRQNEMDRNFAREFVTKVQNVFKDGSTPEQILQQFVAMESHLDAQSEALFNPDKQQFLKEKGEVFKNVLEIFRLTGNLQDLQRMYESLAESTVHNEDTPFTTEQQSFIDLVKNAFNSREETFPISDEEILRHLHDNAVDHQQTMKNYIDITTKINQLINVYENQLTAQEAQQASSLMTDALYKIHLNDKRIKDIHSKTDKDGNPLYTDEKFDNWTALLLENANAQMYFDNNSVLDKNGKPISRSAQRLGLITDLANQLVSIKDQNGKLQYLTQDATHDELAAVNTIAEDVIDAYELDRLNNEYTKAYAQLLTNIVSEVRKYNTLKEKAKAEQERKDLQAYYDEAKKIFDDIKGKKVTEYNEKEITQRLKIILNTLQEYSPDKLFKELESYANKYANGYENFNAMYYFQQLMTLSNKKNTAINKLLRDKIPAEIYQELLDLLPARIAPRIEELLKDPNIESTIKATLRNFATSVSTQHWYRSRGHDVHLGETAKPTSASASDEYTASATRLTVDAFKKPIKTTAAKVAVSSVDDAGKKLTSLFENIYKTAFAEYVKPNFKYDETAHTFTVEYQHNGNAKLQSSSIKENTYQQSPIKYGIFRVVLNLDEATVTLQLIPRNTTEPIVSTTVPYSEANESIHNDIVQVWKGTQAIKDELPKSGVKTISVLLSAFLEFSFIQNTQAPHFMLYFPYYLSTGRAVSNRVQYDETQQTFVTKLNAVLNAAMNKEWSKESSDTVDDQPQPSDNTNVVEYGPYNYKYLQASVDFLEKTNALLNGETPKMPKQMFEMISLKSKSTADFIRWAHTYGLEPVIDDDNHIVGVVFNDKPVYEDKHELIDSQRVFSKGDTIVVTDSTSSTQFTYIVTDVDEIGRLLRAETSDKSYALQVKKEHNQSKIQLETNLKTGDGRVTSDNRTAAGQGSTIPLSEFDFARPRAEGDPRSKWDTNTYNTHNYNQWKEFPTLSQWIKDNSKEAYDNIGFGRVKAGDRVYFRVHKMAGISQKERDAILNAYERMNLLGVLGGESILECFIQTYNPGTDTKQYTSIGFLNPVGAFEKSVIIKEVMQSQPNNDGYFDANITVDYVSDSDESVIYDIKDQPSSQLLKDNFDLCIFLIKDTQGKFHVSLSADKLPSNFWKLVEADKAIKESQLYLIPYVSSNARFAQPIALKYGKSDLHPEDLISYLNQQFDFTSLIQQAREISSNPDATADELKDIGDKIHRALNDTFYIKNSFSVINVQVAKSDNPSEAQLSIKPYETLRDKTKVEIGNVQNLGAYKLQDPSIDTTTIVQQIVQAFLDITAQDAGLRIPYSMVEQAIDQKNETNAATLYSYVQNNLIKTTAVNIRTSNAHPVLNSPALKAFQASKQAEKTKQILPDNAVNVKPDTYQVKKQTDKSFNVGGEHVMHSGGADGSDSYWDEIAEQYGITERHHYYYDKKTPKGNHELTEAEYQEGLEHVKTAYKTLQRGDINKYRNGTLALLSRNWFQVKNSKCVVAIAKSFETARTVSGGAGWAVQMAVDIGIPVYVYNQNSNEWFTFDYSTNTFSKLASGTPILSETEKKSFGAIGTKELDNEGKDAIKTFMRMNFGGQTVDTQSTTPTITVEQPSVTTTSESQPAEDNTTDNTDNALLQVDTDVNIDVDAQRKELYEQFRTLVDDDELSEETINLYLQNESLFQSTFSDLVNSQSTSNAVAATIDYDDLHSRYIEIQESLVEPKLTVVADEFQKHCDPTQNQQ